MQPYTFRLATKADRQAIIDFINTHWGEKHPLVNLPPFFDYYYLARNDGLHFAIAETGGEIAAIAGFVPASQSKNPDIWVSLWVADKKQSGAGLELMAALPGLTGSRRISCNNIRPKTRPFYEFLGYITGRVGHFYRLAEKPAYQIASVAHRQILPAGGRAALTLLPTPQTLHACGFVPPKGHNPYKDLWYIERRYFHYPQGQYFVWAAALPGQSAPAALLATRTTRLNGTAALRIVDYIGEAEFLPQLGGAIQQLMEAENAEYADIYCAGIPADILHKTGFCERDGQDENIIPTYLTPLALQNVDYYYFTNDPENFTLFKADGDQDRPNIQL